MHPRLRATLVDLAPPFILAAASAHELLYNEAPAWQWLLSQVLVWSLALRRRAPVPILVVTIALALACIAIDGPVLAALGTFVALHAVAWLRPARDAVAATVVVGAGAVFASVRLAPARSFDDAVVVLCGLAILSLLLGLSQRGQQRSLRALEARTRELEVERERNAEMAARGERERIAREIHDIVAHSVSVMIALSEGAARAPEPTARSTMRAVARTGRDALADLRRVLNVLGDAPAGDVGTPAAYRPQPVVAGLPALAADVRRAGLEVELSVDQETELLPEGAQTSIYRIVQESVTNVLKHAVGATRVSIELRARAGEVVVVVRDNGAKLPADPATFRAVEGQGLRGMTERARSFKGSVSAGPLPEGGWQVRCDLPLDPEVAG